MAVVVSLHSFAHRLLGTGTLPWVTTTMDLPLLHELHTTIDKCLHFPALVVILPRLTTNRDRTIRTAVLHRSITVLNKVITLTSTCPGEEVALLPIPPSGTVLTCHRLVN